MHGLSLDELVERRSVFLWTVTVCIASHDLIYRNVGISVAGVSSMSAKWISRRIATTCPPAISITLELHRPPSLYDLIILSKVSIASCVANAYKLHRYDRFILAGKQRYFLRKNTLSFDNVFFLRNKWITKSKKKFDFRYKAAYLCSRFNLKIF